MTTLSSLTTALVTLWAAVTLAFFALRIIPGDAIESQFALAGASEAEIEAQRAAFGLNAPVWQQYFQFLSGAVRGDLGRSLISGQPVTQLIVRQWWHTAELAAASVIVTIVVGVCLGTAGTLPNMAGTVARLLIHLSMSTPVYWTATLGIYFLAAEWRILPATGSGSLRHLLLPSAILGFHTGGAVARLLLLHLMTLHRAAFVQAARARGLRERRVLIRHLLPAALPSLSAMVALQIGFLLGGVVMTESIFVRPGLGQMLLQAVIEQDYPMVQGIVLISTATFLLLGLLADMAQRLLDPRLAAAAQQHGR